jgi:hypothetical protein
MRALLRPKLGKPRAWAAVFFGETALELTTARRAGDGLNIERQTSAALPAAEPAADAVTRFSIATQQLRSQLDPREHHIVTAIGGESVLCQTLRLPTTDPAELKQMLDLQIDNLTPLPVEEVVYSFEPIEVTDGETRLLVAVARKTAVNERVAALEAAGLPAEIVGVDALAVFRELVRREVLPADDKLNALVLVSATAANVLVHCRGKLVALRSLLLGAAGLGDAGTQAGIREELQRTLVAAQVESPARETGRVQFATWNESLRDRVAELARGWSGPSECLANGSSPAAAAAVCLETARAGVTQLNLLPDEWRERRRKARVRRRLIRGGIALGVVYVLALAVFLTMMGVQKARLTNVEAKIKGLQAEYDGARALKKTLDAMQRQLDTKYSALELLWVVDDLRPENVKLSGFNFKRDDTVTLRASAQTAALMTEYVGRLEKCELFSKVVQGASRTEPGSGLTKFDVTCTLKTAVPISARTVGGGGTWR